jgi:hypothetical protein
LSVNHNIKEKSDSANPAQATLRQASITQRRRLVAHLDALHARGYLNVRRSYA